MIPRQILFIMTDTTRFDMLGCYGNPDMKTPRLDALASRGVRFERAYTCQPVCGPARSALFTGLFPHSNGSFANSMPLGDNVKTVGQRLRDHGIDAAYIGKWHLDGGDYFGLGRCPDGWNADYWYDMRNYLTELTPEDRLRSRDMDRCLAEGGVAREFTYGHRCSNRAIDYLEKHAGDDFLLALSYDEPHGPFLCPAPYATMYEGYEFPTSPNVLDTLEGKPHYQRAWAGANLTRDRSALRVRPQLYLGCNSFVDDEIGRVLEAAQRYAPDALILFTSDHGDALQSHCIDNKGPAIYEEVARIPFIMAGGARGRAPQGAVHRGVVSHISVVPTMLEYMGIPIPKLLEGDSLLARYEAPCDQPGGSAFVEFGRYEIDHDGFGGFQPMRAIVDARYKLAVHLLDPVDELYDLAEDPHEMRNLIFDPAYAAVRDALHDALLKHMNDTRDPFRGYQWARRPWREAMPMRWSVDGYTRQRENEEYEPRQLDYGTGLEMERAVRKK